MTRVSFGEANKTQMWPLLSEKRGPGTIRRLGALFSPGSRKPRPLALDECANLWPACPDLDPGMSPRLGISQVPRLRAETHFGVQARALDVGLHEASGSPTGTLKGCPERGS
jgi:hypothetical protein